MTRGTKVLLITIALILVITTSASIALRQANWLLFEQRIPPQFELVDRVLQHTELLGACGIAVFRLSDATLEKIQSQRQAFLAGATVARVPHQYPYESYSHYKSWQATPVPQTWRSEGDGAWMYCPPQDDTVYELIDAAKGEGSYYTSADDNQKLLVAPRLGLIVYTHFD